MDGRKEKRAGGEEKGRTQKNNNRRKNNQKTIFPQPLPHKKHSTDGMFISDCCACVCDCKSVMHCVVGLCGLFQQGKTSQFLNWNELARTHGYNLNNNWTTLISEKYSCAHDVFLLF